MKDITITVCSKCGHAHTVKSKTPCRRCGSKKLKKIYTTTDTILSQLGFVEIEIQENEFHTKFSVGDRVVDGHLPGIVVSVSDDTEAEYPYRVEFQGGFRANFNDLGICWGYSAQIKKVSK